MTLCVNVKYICVNLPPKILTDKRVSERELELFNVLAEGKTTVEFLHTHIIILPTLVQTI